MIYLAIFTFCLFLISYYLNKTITSPSFLMSISWFIIFLLFLTIDLRLHPVSSTFILTIFIWISVFYIGSLIIESIDLKTSTNLKPNYLIRQIYFYISIIVCPIAIYTIFKLALNGPSDNILFNLRILSTSKNTLSIWGYFLTLTYIAYLIELIQNENKFKIWILFFINFTIALMVVAKIIFLYLFFSTFIILLIQKRIKVVTIIILFIIIVVFFIALQAFRSYNLESNGFDIIGFFNMYLLASLPAFDLMDINATSQFGGYTFRFIYAIGSSIGFDCTVSNNLLRFVGVPIYTNVYTVLFPYYIDFGIVGVIFFGFFQGSMFGFLYKKAVKGNQIYLILFAAISSSLIMQFFAELFFSIFSTIIQYVFFATLPYMIKTKRND
jgi:oligosaccharide repeat unit polymerase